MAGVEGVTGGGGGGLRTAGPTDELRRWLQLSFVMPDTALARLHTHLSSCRHWVHALSSSSAFTDCTAGVPQGPVLGTVLLSCLTSPINNIASSHAVHLQQYMDHTSHHHVVLTLGSDSWIPTYLQIWGPFVSYVSTPTCFPVCPLCYQCWFSGSVISEYCSFTHYPKQ